MVIYFTGSISANNTNRDKYLTIVNKLLSYGHTVIADHILKANEEDVVRKPRSERLDFHKKVEEWIQGCNCMIAETSYPSVSVGYEIALATRIGIPVLVLHNSGHAPSLLGEHKNELVVSQHYSKETVGPILEDFLSYVKGNRDVKFTLYLSPKHFKHLDEKAQIEQIPKSVYLRRLIDADIKKKP
ncbi:hypothetical protein HYS00_00310 [Candidatus Microgenomates bacterium]|nr:hypothetical protein [Candidatus Microgenomates bacterium]